MNMTPGTKLGPYEIQTPIGKGGMGEVYRATDTKLRRDVALKFLPDHFLDDADRLSRFQREAQVLASLNHPNIAQVYGLEESGNARCIVMELVEGETLADRIARGPIPVEEALNIAHQIADGLEAAHERSIIHRDLKPANVKITPDGKIKIIDFGLAKPLRARPCLLSKSATGWGETVGGNHVIISLPNGHYAFYAHLQPGSIRVKPGEHVRRGQVLGLLGNSGNSDAPHLHFHISNGNSPMGSEGVPFLFDSFQVLGSA